MSDHFDSAAMQLDLAGGTQAEDLSILAYWTRLCSAKVNVLRASAWSVEWPHPRSVLSKTLHQLSGQVKCCWQLHCHPPSI